MVMESTMGSQSVQKKNHLKKHIQEKVFKSTHKKMSIGPFIKLNGFFIRLVHQGGGVDLNIIVDGQPTLETSKV